MGRCAHNTAYDDRPVPDSDEYIYVPEQDPIISEGDEGVQTVEFGVARRGSTSDEATFAWKLVLNDEANAAGREDFSDSTAFSGEGIFAPRKPLVKIAVAVRGDTEVEVDEIAYFTIDMGGFQPVVVDGYRDFTKLTILDDDTQDESVADQPTAPSEEDGDAVVGTSGNDTLGAVPAADLATTNIEGKGGWDSLKVEGDEAVDFGSITTVAGVEQLEFTGSAPVAASFSHLRELTEGSEVMFVGMWDTPDPRHGRTRLHGYAQRRRLGTGHRGRRLPFHDE